MIKKIYRLNESSLKKVLKYKKPFFSYWFIANVATNRLPHSRFAIMLSTKNTKTSVNRNFFRRKFYDLVADYINSGSFDIVFVPKKWKTFDKRIEASIVEFENDILFSLKKIFNS